MGRGPCWTHEDLVELRALVTEGLGAMAISKHTLWPLNSVKKKLRWLRANPGPIANATDWIQGLPESRRWPF